MRIIAGHLKGKKLFAVAGNAVRPTSDRLRETLFNIIAPRIHNAVVLDLFSGTGALGIESLSRGAAQTVFIDHSPKSLAVIQRNIHNCGLDEQSTVMRRDILKNLNCLQSLNYRFDLVFLDPPYHKAMIAKTLKHLSRSEHIRENALIIAEHDRREIVSEQTGPITLTDQRIYGQTVVSFFNFSLTPSDNL